MIKKFISLEEVNSAEYYKYKGIYRATVHLTNRCNLRCVYCGFDSGNDKNAELPFEIIKKIIASLTSYKIRHLDLSGGEITIRKDLFDILALIEVTPMSLGVLTNGTLLTPDLAKRLKKFSIHSLKISFDGLENNHDKLRGKGSFSKAINGLENIINYTPIKVKALMTLTSKNENDAGKLARKLAQMGVWRFAIRPCDSNGRSSADLVPTEKQIEKVYRDLLAVEKYLPKDFIEWSFINPFPHLKIWANNPYLMLEESGRHLTVLANGNVMVDYCKFCADGRIAGNLYKDDLNTILADIIKDIYIPNKENN